eukprot:gene248-328_t
MIGPMQLHLPSGYKVGSIVRNIQVSTLMLVGVFSNNTLQASAPLLAEATDQVPSYHTVQQQEQPIPGKEESSSVATQQLPPGWLIMPFILLLGMIASGPLLYENFWHRNYPRISILLAFFVAAYYIFIGKDYLKPVEALLEYIQFIALVSALYVASGGILIRVNQTATPITNLGLLLLGAVLANLIGTTGASMLLIRPYIRLNQHRIKVYHIVFFIFMVSNIGGALTPIGDPPLFLGFLKGVPFFWTLQHNLMPWLFALFVLALVFLWLDKNNRARIVIQEGVNNRKVIEIIGKRNFIWLLFMMMAIFIDPNIYEQVPAICYHGHQFSFIREVILFILAGLSYKYANQFALQNNHFAWGPIREVAFLFIGIFGTMIPALTFIGHFAQSDLGRELITHHSLYWGTGVFSSVLDNAPTYLNFLTAGMAAQKGDILQVADTYRYAIGQGFKDSVLQLRAISVASVFFGAMTYIGNGPNFMVKSIAEQMNVRMPAFFSYIFRFAIPFLLPTLFLNSGIEVRGKMIC